jgi:hypothetical protein
MFLRDLCIKAYSGEYIPAKQVNFVIQFPGARGSTRGSIIVYCARAFNTSVQLAPLRIRIGLPPALCYRHMYFFQLVLII